MTHAARNDLDAWATDTRNAHLQAPSSQKDCMICGEEFGLENAGKSVLVTRALFGEKAAGRDFRNQLRHCMRHPNLEACLTDPDVWMRPALKADGSKHCEHAQLCTDDASVISENAELVLRNKMGRHFELKQESTGPPDLHLGGRLRKAKSDNGVEVWSFSSTQCVKM